MDSGKNEYQYVSDYAFCGHHIHIADGELMFMESKTTVTILTITTDYTNSQPSA